MWSRARAGPNRVAPLSGSGGAGAPFLPFFLLCLLLMPPAAFSAGAEVGDALSGPVRVELKDGRSFGGRAVAFRDGVLLLRTRLDRGEVEQGFPQAQIGRVHFPGADVVAEAQQLLDDGEVAGAMSRLEAIWRQRAKFLSLVEAEMVELLAALPSAHLETGDPYRAIGLARILLPHARAPEVADRLHEAILLAHYRLEFYEETEELARDWIQAQEDFPVSALGWKILADLALREEDLEKVIWIALQPIAIAGPRPTPHLDGCYALAIHAFHRKEAFERANQLHQEMIDRKLSWPEDPLLAETGVFYQARLVRHLTSEAGANEPDLDLRPPEEDLNLPLNDIRKLLRAEDP